MHLQILHGLWDKSKLQICRFLPTGVLTCSWEVLLLLLACIPQVSTHTYMQAWWALALCMTLWVLCALCERCRCLRHSRYMCMGTGSRCMMQVCYSVVVVLCSYVLVDSLERCLACHTWLVCSFVGCYAILWCPDYAVLWACFSSSLTHRFMTCMVLWGALHESLQDIVCRDLCMYWVQCWCAFHSSCCELTVYALVILVL